MFGCVASNALATSLKVFCWLSSSPPPRQQNQVTVTGPPGGTVGMTLGAATLGATLAATSLGATLAAVLAATDAAGGVVDPPQAPTTRAKTASSAAGRDRRDAMCSSSLIRMASSARGGAGSRRTPWSGMCSSAGDGSGLRWRRGRHRVGVGLPAGPDDDALDVVAGAVAAD